MFFTKTAKVVAWVGFVFAVFNLILGFAIAGGFLGNPAAALKEYSMADTTGEMIDEAFFGALVCIALGTLAEISLALNNKVG